MEICPSVKMVHKQFCFLSHGQYNMIINPAKRDSHVKINCSSIIYSSLAGRDQFFDIWCEFSQHPTQMMVMLCSKSKIMSFSNVGPSTLRQGFKFDILKWVLYPTPPQQREIVIKIICRKVSFVRNPPWPWRVGTHLPI